MTHSIQHLDLPSSHAPRRTRQTVTGGVVAAALLAGTLGGGAAGWALGESNSADAAHATAPVRTTAESTATLDVHRVLAKVEPAVVTVRTRLTGLDAMLQPVAEEGTGTGVIVGKNGVIVTNYHVVAGAQTIHVQLAGGRTLPAKVLGTAPGNDLSVIKVDATDLPTVQLGNSNSLLVGDAVVAIGNALALPGGPTVTEGIVSALNRTIRESDGAELHDVLQTDAAINPGNSGGPLVDAQGRVVGINTATASHGQNIGFAIAVTPVLKVIRRLEDGHSIRPASVITPPQLLGGEG